MYFKDVSSGGRCAMIMITMMILDVLQEYALVNKGKHDVRCCGSAKMFP